MMPSEARGDADAQAKVGKLMSIGVLRKQSRPRERSKKKKRKRKRKRKEKTGAFQVARGSPAAQDGAARLARSSNGHSGWCRLELEIAERMESDQDRKVREWVLKRLKQSKKEFPKRKRRTGSGEGGEKKRKEKRSRKTVMMRIYCVSGVK
ncbi:hypothetical protein P170DRAFT_110749 [Aspergillus steynii IBT 23096]|uniref:Uncharacterized protein n=1 Tax=Aspergillus steynii IBT 23096 TaxID=1392250 RepID=A0A2I2GIJ8_9EURO|nr:uncharacterized protein P170DRAFT_110749 [Aspergillus steynii IBT 23096]PLB52703.1 hypothetical protein P170DRAFT_110749 [Aspergillus steynii IBT 23096]